MDASTLRLAGSATNPAKRSIRLLLRVRWTKDTFLAIVFLVTCFTAGQATGAAALPPTPCVETPFENVRENFLRHTGRIPLATATKVIPADDTARLIFRQPLLDGTNPRIFRAFETNGADILRFTGKDLTVLSVQPANKDSIDGFAPNDSVLLQIEMNAGAFPLLGRRYFVVLGCSAGQISSWGLTAARVSGPYLPLAVCAVMTLLTYLLAMSAVWASRQRPHTLERKYPAIFGAKRIVLQDFINPIHLTANAFNQASVQKLQVLMFSFLVGWLVLSLVVRTGTLADLSLTVVGLLGISGVGAATAQITYQQKTRLSFENWAWLEKKKVLLRPQQAEGPHWRDLVLTNREFDVYKLQTIIFSVAVAGALLTGGASNLSTFTVPPTLLGILGLSQVVYIGGILVRPPAVSELDDALTKLRAVGETVAAAKTHGTDTGADGKLLPTLPPGQPVAANAQRQYDELADSIIPMIESALEIAADRSKLAL